MTYSFSENQWGEKYIEEINRTDFANLQSSSFFDKVLDFDLTVDNTLFIVIGSDSGLILPYLSRQKLGRGSKVSVIEHDDVYPIIARVYRGLLEAQTAQHGPIDQPISLHSFSTYKPEIFNDSFKSWILGGDVVILQSHASTADYARLYHEIHTSVRVEAEQEKATYSVALNRPIFTTMQFSNAVDSTKPLQKSVSFGLGKTAIVMGGGPSLDLHIEWVKANRPKLFILAVSRISNKLILQNIKPDLVLSVDPYDVSYEVSKHGLAWRDVPLVYNYHVEPRMLQHWQGPAFYLGKRLPWHGMKELKGNIPSAGPTVGHTAVVVAWQLGFSTILTSGIDFCFSSTTDCHADDSPEQLLNTLPSLCDAKTETYSGRMAGTNVMLKNGLQSLEEIGEAVNKDENILFNLSLDAGLCPSIPWIDFNNISLETDKPQFSDSFDTTVSLTPLAELARLEKEVKYSRLQCSKIKTLCIAARENIKKIHGKNNGVNSQKSSRKLTKIRKELESDYFDYVDAIIRDNSLAFARTDTPMDFEQMSPEELIKWGCHYYDLLEKGARTFISHIDGLQHKISLRRDEHTGYTDVRALMKRWKDDNTPGRILPWSRVYGNKVPAKDRAWVQRTIGKFRSTLNQTETHVLKKLSPWKNGLNGVLKSLLFLRENEHLSELESVEKRLSGEEWPYCALKPFTLGLISELKSETPEALIQFRASLDISSDLLQQGQDNLPKIQPLLEECLLRLTSGYIRIDDHQSALSTLGTLCEIAPIYIVSYCKMLHTSSQREAAIELLQSYVELYPSNKKAQYTLEGFIQKRDLLLKQTMDPEYTEKINSAMDAIMGNTPGKAA